ncbi:MAG TPA: GNAT family N-acetyltransferase [Acidobacteriota bacterium]|nr:GNAT family N-acetyltransferase [Acidobacteriota bacterium]
MKFRIDRIRRDSRTLDEVKALGKRNAQFLGFFPEGAFDGHAAKGRVIVAQYNSSLAGYVLYRVVVRARKAMIVHLCVHEDYRGQHVARQLVDHLAQETKHLRGIGLHCRRDYPAHSMWPRIGFAALDEKKGRGKDRATLTYWWLDHGHRTLFSEAEEHEARDRAKAVVDANVFFDFQDSSKKADASKALRADWLRDEIFLLVTSELLNEINRCEDEAKRIRSRNLARRWPRLEANPQDQERIHTRLLEIMGDPETEQDASDLRQLAAAVAGKADFFLTKDGGILRAADQLNDSFDIQVLPPRELIVFVDERINAATYQPRSLVGSRFAKRKIVSREIEPFRQRYQQHHLGEKKAQMLRKLETLISDPMATLSVVEENTQADNAEDKVQGALAESLAEPGILDVPLLRITGSHRISLTLFRHLVYRAILKAIRNDRQFVRIREPFLAADQKKVLREMRFGNHDHHWIRFTPHFVTARAGLADEIRQIRDSMMASKPIYNDLLSGIMTRAKNLTPESVFEWEGDLWPSKIQGSNAKNFLVPIRPNWAKELFDKELARQSLFASKAELVLSHENVYYRAARPAILEAPARLLWYVSGQSGVPGSKMIRACSRLLQVDVGPAKEIYSRFKRLGIYQWKDIQDSHRKGARIMAFRFAATELFNRPIPWEKAQSVVNRLESRGLSVQSPFQLHEKTFFHLYRLGSRKGV